MKKQSIIKLLLYDNPCSRESIKMGDEYWKIYDIVGEVEKQIADRIKEDGGLADLIKRYADALDDLAAEETETFFERGVKFGILLGMELAEEN